jgi:hypothetical protein
MSFPRFAPLGLLLAAASMASLAACGGSSNADGGGGGGDGALDDGATQGDGTAGGDDAGNESGLDIDSGVADSALDPDAACAAQSSTATLVKKPVDIIVVVDNSGSMTDEIVGVQKNINANFANILEASGLDYRVIIVARHGSASSGQSICVEAPLSGIPAGGCATPPAKPVSRPPRFFHYSTEIASRDSWCKILSTYATADEFNLAPNGWKEWLRPDAFKTFVEITDDGVGCSYGGKTYQDSNTVAGGTAAAPQFDAALLALAPAQFGTATERNYAFYSIVAMGYNTPATEPYPATAPVVATKCPTAANPGTGHQAMSVLTGALRFPICDTTSYDKVFKAIAAGVIKGAKASCSFPAPTPKPGETIDPSTVVVRYKSGAGTSTLFEQVANAGACKPGAFYLASGAIQLCPDACTTVQADDKADIQVLWGCAPGSIQ